MEQQAVLERPAPRVRVVRAAPGSGKTWLVAELIRQELESWATRTSGIAALSFTRVGGDEILKAVGHELGHPHFVGTIDAFLFRYVLRPYLRRVFSWFAEPRLVVAEWGAKHWSSYGPDQSATVGKGINLFGCVFIGEDTGKAVIAYKPHPSQPLRPLSGLDLIEARKTKMKIWEKRGLLTHSDAALWASKILEEKQLGDIVRAEVVRRFPLIIVDELQDTGHFLGKSIRRLLEDPDVRSVLVGDPDQAIYEFNGARPDLFNVFEQITGAVSRTLASSRRCPNAIANAATHLKDSGGTIGPAFDRAGRAILVQYSDMVPDVQKMMKKVRATRAKASLKVIGRSKATVDDLAGRHAQQAPSLHCPAVSHIHRAVVAIRQGRNISALAAARLALDRATFRHEGVTDDELAAVNIDPRDWKELAVRCLLRVNEVPTTCTHLEWCSKAGEILDEEISAEGLEPSLAFVVGKLKPKKRKGSEKLSADFLPQPNTCDQHSSGIPVQTVHAVKGETHEITIFVCPPPFNAAHCPSTVWWSPDEKDREERRIAYVAMTRTQGDLILCVSESCYGRLASSRAAFVASFECMTVAQFINSLGGATVVDQSVTMSLAAGS
jgi:DNA helicase II / ATP-dependent DNA helicase PcrA